MVGFGTIFNIATILVGTLLGTLLGSKLSEKTSRTVTDSLGLITIVLGGLNLMSLSDKEYVGAVTGPGTFFIVIFAILFGGIIGSLLKIEDRLEGFGGWLQSRFSKKNQGSESRQRFITGYVDASLIFAIGPMAILGSMSDGLGSGADTLVVKSILDGFASIAFAASLGWGVGASAITVGIWQGLLTAIAYFGGAGIPVAMVSSITATGGILMLGIGLRLLNLRKVAVADMLPALVLAPLFTWLVASVL
ncbi:MAG: hypothetical protein RLZZ380_1106 [Actinomycetota bacterium]|jgi:uncharacterized membrane protein YqgA involved in biofilm formation